MRAGGFGPPIRRVPSPFDCRAEDFAETLPPALQPRAVHPFESRGGVANIQCTEASKRRDGKLLSDYIGSATTSDALPNSATSKRRDGR